MKFYSSQFDSNKTYNSKTLSLDGSKVVQEVNTKYLFGFKESSLSKVWEFFFDKTFMKHFKERGITFPENVKKDINDNKCRYILCEKEVISYDIDGNEFSRVTSFDQYDKTGDSFHFQKGKKINLRPQQPTTRSFKTVVKVDNLGNERTVLVPGGTHYNVVPGTLKNKHLCMLGYMTQVEVKMTDSLNIL
jgi:hypothetical protein